MLTYIIWAEIQLFEQRPFVKKLKWQISAWLCCQGNERSYVVMCFDCLNHNWSQLNLPWGNPITWNILSNCSLWYGLLVLMSSWRQWNIGSDVNSSANIHPIAHISKMIKTWFLQCHCAKVFNQIQWILPMALV